MYGVERISTVCITALMAVLGSSAGSGQEPSTARALRVGLFEPDEPWADRVQAGALRAASEWNRSHAKEGLALELVRLPRTARWKDAGAQLAGFIVEHELCAVLGPSSSAAAHVAAQVATRLRVPMITLSSDVSLTAAKDPWIFSIVPNDLEQARVLLRHALPRPEGATAYLVVPPGSAGRARRQALRKACAELGVEAGETCDDQDVVLLWLDAAPARAWLVAGPAVREDVSVLGSLRLRRPELITAAARGARSLLLPVLGDEGCELGEALGRDALRSIALAAADVGPSPESIRAGLARLHLHSLRSGFTGFDARGNRAGSLRVEQFGPPAGSRPPPPSNPCCKNGGPHGPAFTGAPCPGTHHE